LDLVKTKNVNHITEYINTNIPKATANTTKYMKQVWNNVLSMPAFDRQRQTESKT
jgi:hypothetical protein